MTVTSKGFQEIDHTADVGLRIWAPALDELFVEAARGMFSLLLTSDTDEFPQSVQDRKQKTHTLDLTSTSADLLLRDWLSELLYIHTTERTFFTDFVVQQIDDQNLTGQATGSVFSRDDEHLFTEIKAVTYHGLELSRDEEGFRAQVIFDI